MALCGRKNCSIDICDLASSQPSFRQFSADARENRNAGATVPLLKAPENKALLRNGGKRVVLSMGRLESGEVIDSRIDSGV